MDKQIAHIQTVEYCSAIKRKQLKLKKKKRKQLLIHTRANSLEKTQMLGKIEGKKRRGKQRMRWLDSITDSMNTNMGKIWETVEGRGAWRAAVPWDQSQAWLSSWTTTCTHTTGKNPKTWCQVRVKEALTKEYMWFHLYEVLAWAKLIWKKNQNGCF